MLSFIENIGLILQRYGAVFAQGLWNTLWLSFVSVFLGTFLGILVALGKLSRHKLLNGVVSTYIEIIRGTPILLQLYFFWLALPNILPSISDTTCILSELGGLHRGNHPGGHSGSGRRTAGGVPQPWHDGAGHYDKGHFPAGHQEYSAGAG